MSSALVAAAPVPQEERGGLVLQESSTQSEYFEEPMSCSGGGGLVSTIGDYARFCQMLINEGELDGERLLAPSTLRYMRTNQLPNNRDMAYGPARMERRPATTASASVWVLPWCLIR